MYAAGFRYEDLVAAVDVVITKPGYGIISECIANDTALLYTSRGHFVEYDVLVSGDAALPPRALHRPRRSVRRPMASSLDALLDQPPPREPPAVNGAETAAEQLLAFLE